MVKSRKHAASESKSTLPPSPPDSDMNTGEDDADDKEKRASGPARGTPARCLAAARYGLRTLTSTTCAVAALACVVASACTPGVERQSTLLKVGVGYLCLAQPLLSTLKVCCAADPAQDGHGTAARLIAGAFLLSILCHQFPAWLSAAVACGAVFAFGLASRQVGSPRPPSAAPRAPSHNNTKNGEAHTFRRTWSRLGVKERAVVGGLAVVASLLVENFLIWVVSATYQPGIDGSPQSLQDNGRIVMEKMAMKIFNVNTPRQAAQTLQALRDGLSVQWAIVSSLGASFLCLELRLGKTSQRTLPGLALRATTTLAAARLVRTISFVLTVLPSQVPNCYARHFPPPPEDWGAWIMVGFLPSARGGCNDLILSGHATLTSTLGCAFTSTASNTSFSIAVWTLIALDYGIEAYQGLHYSVDMWLGCLVTCLLWQLTKPLEAVEGEREIQNGSMQKAPPLTATIVGLYAVPAGVACAVLTVVPVALANYFLVGYSLWVGVIFSKYGYTNFLQHVLLCELCFGLGVYL